MSCMPDNRPSLFDEAFTGSGLSQQSPALGDGFSILELDRAGLSESRAHALGLPIDGTRHSALRHNVRRLKTFAG